MEQFRPIYGNPYSFGQGQAAPGYLNFGQIVYLSDALDEDMKARVLIHELGHCALLSYNLLYDIHKMVRKEYWLEAEEWLCNYLTDYGIYIFEALFEVLGPRALNAIPKQFDILLGAA